MTDHPRFTKLNETAQFLVVLMILNAVTDIRLMETGEDLIPIGLVLLFSAVILAALRQAR